MKQHSAALAYRCTHAAVNPYLPTSHAMHSHDSNHGLLELLILLVFYAAAPHLVDVAFVAGVVLIPHVITQDEDLAVLEPKT